MSDNPFSEPGDDDRTIIRPKPGARKAAPAPKRPAEDAVVTMRRTDRSAMVRLADGAGNLAVGGTPLTATAAPLLQFLARLRNTARAPDAAALRERAEQQLRGFEQEAEASGVPADQLKQAHYALCASLDDAVLNTPWGATGPWRSRTLLTALHQEAPGRDRFFEILKAACAAPAPPLPLVELMFLCLSLGYQGRTRAAPRDFERVRTAAFAVLERHKAKPPVALAPHVAGVHAPWQAAPFRLPVWVGASAGIAAVGGLWLVFSFALNARSDAAFARMLAAPPAAMPAISRAGPVSPPAAPPQAGPSAQDRLAQRLAPLLAQGQIALEGTPENPVLRVPSRQLFAANGATLQRQGGGLLQRIAAALKPKPGVVSVLGYTDTQPMRSAAFPSTFQLSAARARAAAAALSAAGLAPVTSEGRAGADPIGSNATPQGRAQNQRIEIVLRRPES